MRWIGHGISLLGRDRDHEWPRGQGQPASIQDGFRLRDHAAPLRTRLPTSRRAERRSTECPMRWKTLGAVLLVVVGIGAAALAVAGPNLGGTAATQYLTSQATVTDVVDQVAATGSLAAGTTYEFAFGSAPTVATSTTTASGANTGSNTGAASSWIVETVDVVPGQTGRGRRRPRDRGHEQRAAGSRRRPGEPPGGEGPPGEGPGRPHRDREGGGVAAGHPGAPAARQRPGLVLQLGCPEQAEAGPGDAGPRRRPRELLPR